MVTGLLGAVRGHARHLKSRCITAASRLCPRGQHERRESIVSAAVAAAPARKEETRLHFLSLLEFP